MKPDDSLPISDQEHRTGEPPSMSAVPERQVGQQLGDYQVAREIGRGGMGIVYAAHQVSLNRPVALKVLSASLGLTAQGVQRFRREAEAAARLHHTNIVPVYGIGEQDGTHFYAMELIDGPSLDQVLDRLREEKQPPSATAIEPAQPPAPDLVATGPFVVTPGSGSSSGSSSLQSGPSYFDAVARMTAEVADALAYAHSQGVIHRDIKPSNLMLSAEGRLSLNDFGLARVLEQPGLTQTGDMLGTPAYMSPEQITAGRVPLDHRSDVYSLGATLYELLTLHRPFRGEGRDQVLAQIIHKEPAPPRKINRAVPLDLETICLKCLEKDPDRRYQSGTALADDLRRFVLRQAILARRVGPLERLAKWCRRHPGLAASLAGLLLAVVLAGFFAQRAYEADGRARTVERKRQAEQRKVALDRALLEAMSANFHAAQVALNEAVRLGASEGEELLLRGQIELHQGRAEEAIASLERAVDLLPDSIAARAVLRGAYRDAGQFDRYYVGIGEVYRMQPVSPEDCLFVGQVLSGHYHPRNALPLLEKAADVLRTRPIARLILCEALIRALTDSGQAADLERVLAEAAVVKSLLPATPVATAVNIDAQVAVACYFESIGDEEKRQDHLHKAEAEVKALRDLPPFQRGVRACMGYFDVTGDDAAILAEYDRVKDSPSGRIAARAAYHAHFRRGDYARALAVLDQFPAKGDETMHMVRRALADSHLPGGLRRAENAIRAHRAARAGKRYDGRIDNYGNFLYLWLGRHAELVEVNKAAPGIQGHPYPRYLAGDLAEAELLAVAGNSRWSLCECHFGIGMNRLAHGDRKGARVHFEKCVQTRIVGFIEYELSRCFLAHLERDPRWPGCIGPMK
jgi:serine/threonine protein kinase